MKTLKYLILLVTVALSATACGKKADPGLPEPIVPDRPAKFMAAARAEGVYILWKAPDTNVNDTPLLDLGGVRIMRAQEPRENLCPNCPKNFIQLCDIPYKGDRGKAPDGKQYYYQDKALEFGTVYFYKMMAYNEREKDGKQTKTIAVFWDRPAAAPEGLTMERRNRLLVLRWDFVATLDDGTPLEGLAGYNIYRTTAQGVYEERPLNEEPVSEPRYEDVPEKIDESYFYTVRAVRKVGETLIESAPSAEVQVAYMDVAYPDVPKGLMAVSRKDGVLLVWEGAFQKDLSGYNIYRRETEGFVRLNSAPVTQNSWLDATVRAGGQYVYAVTSVDASAKRNESPLSEPAAVQHTPE